MKKILLIAAAAIVSFSASAQNLKFAHVNYTELVQLMPEADQARAAISASSKEAEETFQGMYEEYQNKLTQYQQKAESWTAAVRQLMAPIQQKAIEAVEKLAKEGGYIYVFETGSLLYIDTKQSTDLTPAARKALGIADGRTLETLQAELQAQAQQQ